jgi:hypothetical protein
MPSDSQEINPTPSCSEQECSSARPQTSCGHRQVVAPGAGIGETASGGGAAWKEKGGGDTKGRARGGGEAAPGGPPAIAVGALGSGGLAPCPDAPPKDGASALASDVAAAGSPVAQSSTAGTLAVASATAVPPPMASASATATGTTHTACVGNPEVVEPCRWQERLQGTARRFPSKRIRRKGALAMVGLTPGHP